MLENSLQVKLGFPIVCQKDSKLKRFVFFRLYVFDSVLFSTWLYRNTSGLWLPCINLLLIANLYLSLSVSSLCGKFILITRKVLHTFWSVLTPVAFVILVLGLSEFTVRYEQQLQAAQGKPDGGK